MARGRWPDSQTAFWNPQALNGARRRPPYEDQNARISILAKRLGGKAGYVFADCSAEGNEPLAGGAGHTFTAVKRGSPTARGGRWAAAQVKRVLDKLADGH